MKLSKKILFIILFSFALNIHLSYAQEQAVTQTLESQQKTSPTDALQMLKDGNQRFIDSNMNHRDLLEQVKATAKGQYPYAVVLSCIDSRVAPELVFDQGIGDIFDVRIAGNFVNEDILGSLEFACKVSGAKLILVMGHTNCGAIKGAIDNVQLGNLTGMLDKIKPSVEKTKYDGLKSSKNHAYVDLVSKENILRSIELIKQSSTVLKEMLEKGEISIAGCMYDLDTGTVEFY